MYVANDGEHVQQADADFVLYIYILPSLTAMLCALSLHDLSTMTLQLLFPLARMRTNDLCKCACKSTRAERRIVFEGENEGRRDGGKGSGRNDRRYKGGSSRVVGRRAKNPPPFFCRPAPVSITSFALGRTLIRVVAPRLRHNSHDTK